MWTWGSVSPSPGFKVHVAVGDLGIVKLAIASRQTDFLRGLSRKFPQARWERNDRHPLIQSVSRQLEEYFKSGRREFDLPLSPHGTPFQKRVWNTLLQIPYGQTRSYGDIARAVGSPKGARAVGMANHDNPIGILVPCHRVIAAGGGLGGYACGLHFKQTLLDLESVSAAQSAPAGAPRRRPPRRS